MICKDCRHLNTEPFETQCDGVTPVVVPPDRGYCMHFGNHLEVTLMTTDACKGFAPSTINSQPSTPQ